MAIAYDATSTGGPTAGTSLTVSHTCSGSNRLLVVLVKSVKVGGGDIVSGVTYAGVAMTQACKIAQVTSNEFYIYYLVAPATGANNIVVSYSATASETGLYGLSYTGVKQASPLDATNTGNGASPNTRTVTTTTDNCWLVGYFCSDNGSAVAASTGTTSRNNVNYRGMACDSNGAKTPPGSFSLVATGTTTITGLIASFIPALDESFGNPLFFRGGLAVG